MKVLLRSYNTYFLGHFWLINLQKFFVSSYMQVNHFVVIQYIQISLIPFFMTHGYNRKTP